MSTQGYIDRATQIKSVFSIHNGNKHTLVMSDEFNEDGRSFAAGRDLLFEALDKPDNSNEAMQYYSSDYVTTRNGSAIISTKAVKTSWYELEGEEIVQKTKNYTSGLQPCRSH